MQQLISNSLIILLNDFNALAERNNNSFRFIFLEEIQFEMLYQSRLSSPIAQGLQIVEPKIIKKNIK